MIQNHSFICLFSKYYKKRQLYIDKCLNAWKQAIQGKYGGKQYLLSKSLMGFEHFSCECYRIKAPQLLQGKKQEAKFLFPLNMSGSTNSFFTKTVQLQLFREKKMLYNHCSLVVPFFFSQIFHVIKKYLSKKSVIYIQCKV